MIKLQLVPERDPPETPVHRMRFNATNEKGGIVTTYHHHHHHPRTRTAEQHQDLLDNWDSPPADLLPLPAFGDAYSSPPADALPSPTMRGPWWDSPPAEDLPCPAFTSPRPRLVKLLAARSLDLVHPHPTRSTAFGAQVVQQLETVASEASAAVAGQLAILDEYGGVFSDRGHGV